MGRPQKPPKLAFKIWIDEPLAIRLQLLLHNPVLDKTPHGALSEFFQGLLLDYFSAAGGRSSGTVSLPSPTNLEI